MLQGEQWVILLYFLPSENESKLKQQIITSLKAYIDLTPDNIQLTHRQQKYSAIIKVSSEKGKLIEQLKSIKVGQTIANIKRYYYDYQLFINKMPKDIPQKQISKYFSNFGEVQNVVLVPSLKPGESQKYSHCFIKFSLSNSVDKVLLVRKLQINGRQVKAYRTYRIGQNESTDKKLDIIIEPIPQSIDVFQNNINQYFQSLGQLRERTRLQVQDKKLCYGVLTFTSKQNSINAYNKFDQTVINKNQYKITLREWTSNRQQGVKIFVAGIQKQFDQPYIKSIFESYGQITDLTLNSNKMGTLYNAIIIYAKKSSANLLLAEFIYNKELVKMFIGKPLIENFMSAPDRKNYSKYMNKDKPQKSYQGPLLPPQQMFQPQFFPPHYQQGPQFMQPMQFIPRPNQNFKN